MQEYKLPPLPNNRLSSSNNQVLQIKKIVQQRTNLKSIDLKRSHTQESHSVDISRSDSTAISTRPSSGKSSTASRHRKHDNSLKKYEINSSH